MLYPHYSYLAMFFWGKPINLQTALRPCSEIADAIVATGRRALEEALKGLVGIFMCCFVMLESPKKSYVRCREWLHLHLSDPTCMSFAPHI